MNNKKVLAGLMTLAMAATCFTPMVAKADTIDSGAVYVDKEIYTVTLPTTSAQKFYLDPEGLASGTAASGTWTQGTEGSVITDATGMTATNSSSKTVFLQTKLNITSSETVTGTPDCAIGTASADTIAATTPTIFMEATFTDKPGTAPGATATLPTNLTSGKAALTASAVAFETKLPAATYTFKLKSDAEVGSTDSSDYEYVMTANTESGVNIKLTGNCAKDADWSDFVGEDATKSVSIEAVFKFYEAKATSTTDPTEIIDTANEVEVVPTKTLVAATPTVFTFSTTKAMIKKVTRADGTEVPAARWSYAQSSPAGTLTLTFDGTFATNNIAGVSASGEVLTVTFGDDSTTTIKIIGTKAD